MFEKFIAKGNVLFHITVERPPPGSVAEAPWSEAEWAVALRFDNPRATVLVLLLGDNPLQVLGFQTPETPLKTLRTP